MNPRLQAVCDLQVGEAREYAGLHDYDGVLQDLSPSGVAAGLARLGNGPAEPDSHDEAHLAAFEAGMRASFAVVEEHRRNPLLHLGNLDLSCYDREYAPAAQRDDAARRHVAGWSDAIDASLESLDMVSAPVAEALLPAVKGLAAGVSNEDALSAHQRFVAHVEKAAAEGDPDPSIGADNLRRLMGDMEALPIDLGRLAERADSERDRLRTVMYEACRELDAEAQPHDVLRRLRADHPTTAEEIYAEARKQIDEATAFTLDHDLLPELGGECLVGPAPESRRTAMAMMSWSAPFEPDAPSWYYVTPPDPSWPAHEQEEWLEVFSKAMLPAITVHEVTPGHYAHGRMLRRARGDVRRALFSPSFAEGWAHYAEELFVEEGFRDNDPAYIVGMAVEALLRVTRLAVAIGVHTGAMPMDEAVHRFETDAYLAGPAARSEAYRATWDPGYGRYTLGKLEIMKLRDEACARWGSKYSHRRFHESLLGLGAPPLGLMDAALG